VPEQDGFLIRLMELGYDQRDDDPFLRRMLDSYEDGWTYECRGTLGTLMVRVGPPDDWWGCRLWQGPIDRNGYGRCSAFEHYAHRLSYSLVVGEIPPSYQIDHLCERRACVNPSHLEAVTKRENLRRKTYGYRLCNDLYPKETDR
jgi:hypothetical protein